MKKRNPFAVFVLSIITLGIYDIYWLVVTKKELNQKTRVKTPTIWLLFSPFMLLLICSIIVAIIALKSKAAGGSSGSSAGMGASAFVVLIYVFSFLVILPVSFYWFWKFSKAVNEYTGGKSSTGVNFLLLWLVHLIGVAIIQDTFNDMLDAGTAPGVQAAPVAASPSGAAVPQAQPPQQSPPPTNQPPVPPATPPAVP